MITDGYFDLFGQLPNIGRFQSDFFMRDIVSLNLVFDQAVSGEILLDDVGFARLGDGFWSAR